MSANVSGGGARTTRAAHATSNAGTASAPSTPGLPKPWSTPRYYRVQRLAALVATALFFFVAQASFRSALATVKTIGRDSAPSIIASQEISSALADLDANGANYLLGNRDHAAAAMQAFEVRRTQATKRIVDAAENVTYGDAEKVPILTMLENIGRYLELFSEARYRHDLGDQPGAIGAYRKATELMHTVILPAANDLDRANKSYMDGAYTAQRSADGSAEMLAAATGALVAGVLLWAQLFMWKRARRIVNVPLAGATLLALIFTVHAVRVFADANDHLKVAKEDAFESIHAMWQARAVAYDANGDESRYLLDRDHAADLEKSFNDRIAQLSTSPAPTSAEISLLSRGQKPAWKGLFATELGNITFDGELAAAVSMTSEFGRYYLIDRRVRDLALRGKRDEAIELCIGSGLDESNAAFAKFDDALEKVVAINKTEFDRVIAESEHALQASEYENPIVAIAVALLTILGFRGRLREYEA